MQRIYEAILKGNLLEWANEVPKQGDRPIRVYVTLKPDTSRLYSVEESRRIAEASIWEAPVRGAEIEHLDELIRDKLASSRGNKWATRAGCLPARAGESCTMWDNISRWGQEAKDIWEVELTKYIGKLKKPYGWKHEGDVFSQEHFDAIMASVGNYQIWLDACDSVTAPPVVVTPAPTPQPTP